VSTVRRMRTIQVVSWGGVTSTSQIDQKTSGIAALVTSEMYSLRLVGSSRQVISLYTLSDVGLFCMDFSDCFFLSIYQSPTGCLAPKHTRSLTGFKDFDFGMHDFSYSCCSCSSNKPVVVVVPISLFVRHRDWDIEVAPKYTWRFAGFEDFDFGLHLFFLHVSSVFYVSLFSFT
jgi:hypothetical protein